MTSSTPIPARSARTAAVIAALAAVPLALTGCVANAAPGQAGAQRVAVSSSDTACEVSTGSATSGTVTFTVKNTGTKVTEFYLLGENKLTIVGEVENIAPGTSRDLTAQLGPGSYFTACKPGMTGAGIGQAAFTVSGEQISASPEADAVVQKYVGYVKSQSEELVPQVQQFVAAYQAGDDREAKRLFPLARVSYERIEPTASSFGTLDPRIDYRKPGADEEGLPFTGFHRIEMDLWHAEAVAGGRYAGDDDLKPLTAAQRKKLGDQLLADVTELRDKVAAPDFSLTLSGITEGAKGLLDEVAAPDGKLSGEENEFAHTDLYDFTANVEGAQVAFDTVRDLAIANGDTALVTELDRRFADMTKLLASYGSYAQGFVSYDTVDDAQRAELAATLNALSEPLSRLTAAVVKN